MDISELDNDQLWEVLEAIRFEMARREGHHPHTGNPGPIHGSLGAVVRPAWSMREWAPKGGGDGKLLSPSSGPPVLHGLMEMLATFSAHLQLGTPRINTFSGDATPGKTEVSFDQWYHEVQCVKDH